MLKVQNFQLSANLRRSRVDMHVCSAACVYSQHVRRQPGVEIWLAKHEDFAVELTQVQQVTLACPKKTAGGTVGCEVADLHSY